MLEMGDEEVRQRGSLFSFLGEGKVLAVFEVATSGDEGEVVVVVAELAACLADKSISYVFRILLTVKVREKAHRRKVEGSGIKVIAGKKRPSK